MEPLERKAWPIDKAEQDFGGIYKVTMCNGSMYYKNTPRDVNSFLEFYDNIATNHDAEFHIDDEPCGKMIKKVE